MKRSYRGKVYRNFATAYPSQDLMDDIAVKPADQKTLSQFYYGAGTQPDSPVERILNRSVQEIVQAEINEKFKPSNWYVSRFSDGSWSVLYAAETEVAATEEALYHLRSFLKEEIKKFGKVLSDRRVVCLKVLSERCEDLISDNSVNQKKIKSPSQKSYSYCQKLAQKLRNKGCEMLRTPSARSEQGVCTPLFSKSVIQKDLGHLKYLKIVMTPGETKIFRE